jgi:hypothetical protein
MKKRVYLNIVEGDINEVNENEYYATRDENGKVDKVVKSSEVKNTESSSNSISTYPTATRGGLLMQMYAELSHDSANPESCAFFEALHDVIQDKIQKGEYTEGCISMLEGNALDQPKLYFLHINTEDVTCNVIAASYYQDGEKLGYWRYKLDFLGYYKRLNNSNEGKIFIKDLSEVDLERIASLFYGFIILRRYTYEDYPGEVEWGTNGDYIQDAELYW